MEVLNAKADFLRSEYITLLQQLPESTPHNWGKMDVRQMIEHMADYVRIANGKTPMAVVTPEENIVRMQAFLQSEKPFKENTPNALMAEEPPPYRLSSKEAAIEELKSEIEDFFAVFAGNDGLKIANPFFGHLNYEMQVQLLHKHATHHLRQCGVTA